MTESTLLFVGISHNHAPLEVRERCAVVMDERDRVRAELHQRFGPVVLLSTCGRSEVYLDLPREAVDSVEREAIGWLSARAGVVPEFLSSVVEVGRGDNAVVRAVRVACGLESALEGEDEILGQVRRAWLDAAHAGTLSPTLDAMFRLAVRTGRQARRIGSGGAWTSLADSGAARLAVAVERQARPRVLVAGSGPIGLRAARTLRSRFGDSLNLALAGRTPARVAAHAEQIDARPLALADLPDALAWADGAVVGLRTRTPLIGPAAVAVRAPERPLTIVDLSLPRAVEVAVGMIPNVVLLNVDRITTAEQRPTRWDTAERAQVERLVERAVREYATLAKRTGALDTLTTLRMQAESIRRMQLARTLRRLPQLDPESRWAVDALTRSIVNRVLHTPTMRLKETDGETVSDQVQDLFGLG